MKEKDQPIIFDPIEHKYTIKATGEHCISPTQLIGRFHEEFDKFGTITERYAKKNGLTVNEVKHMWGEINKTACDYGTAVHESLEHYINFGEILDNPYSKIVENFSKIKFEGKLFSEKRVYSLNDRIAGTVDLIEKLPNSNLISVLDFKTNKELKKRCNFGNKMLGHLSYMDDVNFNHYTLQLSIYGHLCELHGLKVKDLTLLYVNPKSYEIEIHPVKYLKHEVMKMIDLYNLGQLPTSQH